jgi:putative methionine-R-sulfoxide reductase with GAF domain
MSPCKYIGFYVANLNILHEQFLGTVNQAAKIIFSAGLCGGAFAGFGDLIKTPHSDLGLET